jgi:1-deoxy-D-xylulose-5-phosphate reductoisomerase
MNISILGVTGSIGLQTLDIIREHDSFDVVAVSCNTSIDKLQEIIHEFHPKYVSIGSKEDADSLSLQYPSISFGYGIEGLKEAAAYGKDVMVVNALVGSVGLVPTIEAIKKGRTIALANKETLVIGGEVIAPMLEEYGARIIPVDSEHSAIFQCMKNEEDAVSRLIITASGGSFRDKSREELKGVTVEQALAHPNWSMGAKITVDSATMVNKGLEVIEAHYLFQVPYDRIDTVLHKKSIVHSLVEFNDGSMLAHLGNPDMRVPINYALFYPKRVAYNAERLDLSLVHDLQFEPLSYERYPLLQVAIEAGKKKGFAPCIFNAANEAAVALFLKGKISFLQIEDIIIHTMDHFVYDKVLNVKHLLECDTLVRQYVKEKHE